MTIYEKIERGDYHSKLAWVPRPFMPSILKKPALELTSIELSSLSQIKDEYDEDLRKYYQSVYDKTTDSAKLAIKFWLDVFIEYDLPVNPFTNKMKELAWDKGHNGGFGDVLSEFLELLPLWEMYNAK